VPVSERDGSAEVAFAERFGEVLRREQRLTEKLRVLEPPRDAATTGTAAERSGMATIPDERLELVFLCCHPALAPQALYLIFNQGWGDGRTDLAAEAIRLTRVLDGLLSDHPRVTALLALMLLHDSRRAARIRDGEIVPLAEQDRGRWDAERVAEGRTLLHRALARGARGPYALQAAIADLQTEDPIDWTAVSELYDALLAETGSPVVALNRAVAVAETRGPAAALAIVDELDLGEYRYLHSTRAELLRRLGDAHGARAAYDRALALTTTEAERRFLQRRRSES
jgi:RNA polymerase sigma-70 factor, ECF subfamily